MGCIHSIRSPSSTNYYIPILTYHSIDYKKNRFSVTPEVLRSHLEKLYNAGYITAPLSDIIAKKSYLKKQKVVILRFDDSTKNQFNYIEGKNGKLLIDPKCAVGIYLIFIRSIHRFGKHCLSCCITAMLWPTQISQKKAALSFKLWHGNR